MKSSAIRWLRLVAPWQWPVWLALGLAWALAHLPLRTQYRIGRRASVWFFRLVPRRKRVIRKNLELAFPDMSDVERETLVEETIRSLGLTVMDTLFVWMRGIDPVMDRVRIHGLEHMRDSENSEPRGTVMLGAHFASLDLVAAALSRKCPFGATYRKIKNPVVDFVCRRARSKYYDQMFEATSLRTLARGLTKGRIIWFATDQDMGNRKSTCFVPFFGIEASTVVTPFRLARKTGARVLFMSHRRNSDDYTWELTLTPVELTAAAAPTCFAEDAKTVNGLIEDCVRAEPSQYFWVHRRFKSMANGSRRDYVSA